KKPSNNWCASSPISRTARSIRAATAIANRRRCRFLGASGQWSRRANTPSIVDVVQLIRRIRREQSGQLLGNVFHEVDAKAGRIVFEADVLGTVLGVFAGVFGVEHRALTFGLAHVHYAYRDIGAAAEQLPAAVLVHVEAIDVEADHVIDAEVL